MYNKHFSILKTKLSILTFLLFCAKVSCGQDNSSLYRHVDSLMQAELGFDYDSISNIEKEVAVKKKEMPVEKEEARDSGKRGIICRVQPSMTSKSPLLILDGIPIKMDELNKHKLSTIKEIIVLKDAYATAIYGSRASYGVISITSSNSFEK